METKAVVFLAGQGIPHSVFAFDGLRIGFVVARELGPVGLEYLHVSEAVGHHLL